MPNKPKRRAVSSRCNSECGSAKLESLDFTNWWIDTSGGNLYLHVAGNDGETFHRVYCRVSDRARLGMFGGELFWLIDG